MTSEPCGLLVRASLSCGRLADGARGAAILARFEHDNFAADETENGRRNTGGLPSSWRCFDDEVGRMLQDCQKLRQNRIHRKRWLSHH
jgi:hypothetical protein